MVSDEQLFIPLPTLITEQMAQFGLDPGLPGRVIIGRDGKIVAIHRSVVTQEEIKKHLDKSLSLVPPENPIWSGHRNPASRRTPSLLQASGMRGR